MHQQPGQDMTAYELADAIEDWETGANYTVSIKAANMLRQQADRIVELEKQLQPEISVDHVCKEEDGCPTETAVLKRFWRQHQQTNAEPVAELLVNDGEPWGCRYDDNITLAGVDGWIPLYTKPQTKDKE